MLGVLALAGCASTVTGAGVASVSPSASGSSPDFPSGSAGPPTTSRFPRTPLSTAIGDPPTADLCAAIPLSSFTGLGYTPAYSTSVFPPGCSVRMNSGTSTKFSVDVFGIGSDNFSHLAPPDSSGPPRRTGLVAGLQVDYYAFDKTLGNCQRDVMADGVTLRVVVLSRAGPGKADERADCAGADAMTAVVAKVAVARSVPRLPRATPSISVIDFCAVLRATKVADVSGYADAKISNDGVGDGCQLVRGDFDFYIDFGVGSTRQPVSSKPMMVGGHVLYASDSNDSTFCDLTSAQGTSSDGRFEQVLISASDFTVVNKLGLCQGASTVAARFLDTAGLK